MCRNKRYSQSHNQDRNHDDVNRAIHSPSSVALLLPGTVLRAGRVRLPYHNIRNPRTGRQLPHLASDLVVKIFRKISAEGSPLRNGSKSLMNWLVKPADDLANYPLQLRKVTSNRWSQLWTLDAYAHTIVMPVYVLALAAIAAQRVPSECLFYANLKT